MLIIYLLGWACACVVKMNSKIVAISDAKPHEENASAGNRTRVTSMATMYSTTRPLMQLP